MDKEKNINDLLSSIRKLINEAEDEVLNFQNKERLIDIGSALPNKEKPLEECSVKNTNQNILTNDSGSSENLSWENINFKKYQKEILINKNELSEKINNYFHQSLDNWVKNKLSKLIDVEVEVYAKNKLREKLK